MNNGDLFGSPVFLIIYCGTMKVTHKSGRTFRQNPVRAGLVKVAEDWPYQGEIVYIDRA